MSVSKFEAQRLLKMREKEGTSGIVNPKQLEGVADPALRSALEKKYQPSKETIRKSVEPSRPPLIRKNSSPDPVIVSSPPPILKTHSNTTDSIPTQPNPINSPLKPAMKPVLKTATPPPRPELKRTPSAVQDPKPTVTTPETPEARPVVPARPKSFKPTDSVSLQPDPPSVTPPVTCPVVTPVAPPRPVSTKLVRRTSSSNQDDVAPPMSSNENLSESQGSLNQGNFNNSQGSFNNSQGSFNNSQGSFNDNKRGSNDPQVISSSAPTLQTSPSASRHSQQEYVRMPPIVRPSATSPHPTSPVLTTSHSSNEYVKMPSMPSRMNDSRESLGESPKSRLVAFGPSAVANVFNFSRERAEDLCTRRSNETSGSVYLVRVSSMPNSLAVTLFEWERQAITHFRIDWLNGRWSIYDPIHPSNVSHVTFEELLSCSPRLKGAERILPSQSNSGASSGNTSSERGSFGVLPMTNHSNSSNSLPVVNMGTSNSNLPLKEESFSSPATTTGIVIPSQVSLQKLIEAVTDSETLDPELNQTVILTYRSFATPEEMWEALKNRYMAAAKSGEVPKSKTITLRVCIFTLKWTQEARKDFSPELREEILKFYKQFVSVDHGQTFLTKQTTAFTETTQSFHILGSPPPAKFPKSILKLSDMEPLEIARQWTMQLSKIYLRLRPNEFFKCGWTKNDRTLAPTILEMIDMFNRISAFTASAIVSEKDIKKRVITWEFLIRVATHLREFNNFHLLMSMISGFSNSSVQRLKQTLSKLASKSREAFTKLEQEMEIKGSYKIYRDLLSTVTGPRIPYFGVHLQDLVFIEEANPDSINGLINWEKRKLIFTTISDLCLYAQNPYNFIESFEMQRWFEKAPQFDDKEMYERSCQCEASTRQRGLTSKESFSLIDTSALESLSSSPSKRDSLPRGVTSDKPRKPVEKVNKVEALADYESPQQGVFSLKKGEVLDVLEKLESGWWICVRNGQKGYCPSTIVREYYEPVVKVDPKREKICKEILSTEESYVSALSTAINLYLKPLLQAVDSKSPIISEEEIRSLFNTIEALAKVNGDFCLELKMRITKFDLLETEIGDLMLDLAGKLELYTTYVNNFDATCKVYAKCLRKAPKFVKLNETNRTHPDVKGLDLLGFLIAPIQRVPRYILLVEDLIKNTPEQHPDYESLVDASKLLKEKADLLNEAKRHSEKVQTLIEIQNAIPTLPFELPQEGRELVREIEVEYDKKSAKLYLLSDLIILAASKGAKLFMCIALTDINVVDEKKPCKLLLGDGKKKHEITLTNDQDKQDWLNLFKSTLISFKKSNKLSKML